MTDRRVADELAIRNVLGKMAQLADSEEELAAYRQLFAEDGSWTLLASPRAENQEAVTHVGRAAIVEGALRRRSAGGQGPGSNVMHDVTTVVVEFESDDVAHSTAYFKLFGNTDERPRVLGMGRYVDTFVRNVAGWQVSSRVILPA